MDAPVEAQGVEKPETPRHRGTCVRVVFALCSRCVHVVFTLCARARRAGAGVVGASSPRGPQGELVRGVGVDVELRSGIASVAMAEVARSGRLGKMVRPTCERPCRDPFGARSELPLRVVEKSSDVRGLENRRYELEGALAERTCGDLDAEHTGRASAASRFARVWKVGWRKVGKEGREGRSGRMFRYTLEPTAGIEQWQQVDVDLGLGTAFDDEGTQAISSVSTPRYLITSTQGPGTHAAKRARSFLGVSSRNQAPRLVGRFNARRIMPSVVAVLSLTGPYPLAGGVGLDFGM